MNKIEIIEELAKLPDRERKLSKIKRYEMYHPMFYRPDVYFHSMKIFFMLCDLKDHILSVYPAFDFKRAQVMALIHDDPEIIMGDFQAGNRAKLDAKQLEKLQAKEDMAINKLSSQYPKIICGENYKEVLLELFAMNTIESNVVKYLDRFDAFCEALHEIYAGNISFTVPVTTEYGDIELPIDYYFVRFDAHEKNYPMITDLIMKNRIPFMSKVPRIDIKNVCSIGKLHTVDSLSIKKGYEPYDYWLSVMTKNLPEEFLLRLTTKKE